MLASADGGERGDALAVLQEVRRVTFAVRAVSACAADHAGAAAGPSTLCFGARQGRFGWVQGKRVCKGCHPWSSLKVSVALAKRQSDCICAWEPQRAADDVPPAVGDAVWLALARRVGTGTIPPPPPAVRPCFPPPLAAADFPPAERLLPTLWAGVDRAHLRRVGRAAACSAGPGLPSTAACWTLPAALQDGQAPKAQLPVGRTADTRAEGVSALRAVLARLGEGPATSVQEPSEEGGYRSMI